MSRNYIWQRFGNWRTRALAMFAILGPGIITAVADNDAGGISTFSVVGANYGYSLLWIVLLVKLSMVVTQEMGARMGAVTGKGLAALIRERYGVRWTTFAMIATLLANLATTVAEFAGVAAAGELFGVPRFISVPLAAVSVWALVLRLPFASVERVFLLLSAVYLAYPISGILIGPDWGEVARAAVTPTFRLEMGWLLVVIATIGTTITPWGQFFIQSYVADKGVGPRDYPTTRIDVIVGAVVADVIALFIIVTTASTLYTQGINITSAEEAAMALEPVAGTAARYLFGLGLLNASLLGACILPLSTSYTICQAFGWEEGVDHSFREAPAFHGLYGFTIAFGALVALIPGLPLFPVMVFAQDVNGVLLIVVLTFAIKLASDRAIMGEYASGRFGRTAAWLTTGMVVVLTVLLIIASTAELLGMPLG